MMDANKFPKLSTVGCFIVLAVLLWFSPLCTPKIVLEVTYNVASQSQLFRNEGRGFAEQYSEVRPVSVGTDRLVFNIDKAESPLRWDPTQTADNLKVSTVYIRVSGVSIGGAVTHLRPAHQIAELKNTADGYLIRTTENAGDAQVFVDFDVTKVSVFQGLISVFFASFIMVAHRVRHKVGAPLKKTVNFFTSKLIALKQRLAFSIKEFFILLFMAVVLNSYFIANLSLSIDDEWGATRDNPDVWIQQGRWAVYLIEKILLPQPALPLLPYLILDVCITFSYMLLVRMHSAAPSWKTYLAFPVFCSYPTWWLISEFSSNVPAVALGLLLSVLAAYASLALTTGGLSLRKIVILATGIIFILAVAIACYQSMLFLYLDISFGVMLINIVFGGWVGIASVSRNSLICLIVTVGAMMLYFGINQGFLWATGLHNSYIGNFININELVHAPVDSMRRIVQEASLVYSGASSRFGDDIGLATLILVLSSSVVLIASLRKGQVIAGVLWFMVLAIPFMLHFIAGATGVPLRSMISLSYSAWLMVLIILTAATRQGLVWMAVPLISIYLMQLISLNSQYIASASLTQRHDELLAADIYRRLGELDDTFDGGDVIMVDFFGHKPFETVYAVAWSSAAQGSFFDWGNGNTARMLNYMKILGYQNLRVVDQNVRTSLTPTFLKMPVWPAQGSVAKVDGIYLIRLSGAADPGHQ